MNNTADADDIIFAPAPNLTPDIIQSPSDDVLVDIYGRTSVVTPNDDAAFEILNVPDDPDLDPASSMCGCKLHEIVLYWD